jgi:hypothetical protein
MTMATSQKEMSAMGIRGRERSMIWGMWLVWLLGVLLATGGVQAQAGKTSLTLWLRDSQGTAVSGESLLLLGVPEEMSQPAGCVTDADGRCTWSVRRGIYQVIFSRPLDPVSALAVAEGGLRGLGVTVGDTAVAYHFTFHSDGSVYFDAAPETVVPQPLIPTGEMLHGGVWPTPTAPLAALTAVAMPAGTPPPLSPSVPAAARYPTPAQVARLLFFLGGGLLIGWGFYRYGQQTGRHQPAPQPDQTPEEEGLAEPDDLLFDEGAVGKETGAANDTGAEWRDGEERNHA